MRNTMIPIMTFLASSFWMDLPSRIIHEPKTASHEVKGWCASIPSQLLPRITIKINEVIHSLVCKIKMIPMYKKKKTLFRYGSIYICKRPKNNTYTTCEEDTSLELVCTCCTWCFSVRFGYMCLIIAYTQLLECRF